MIEMIKDLFINEVILIAYIFISASFLKEQTISRKSSVIRKLLFGAGGAVLSVILMYFSIKVPGTNTIIDLRFFPLIYMYFYAGFVPTIVTGIGIILYRTLFFGISYSSILATISIFLFILSYYIIDKIKMKHRYKIWSYFFSNLFLMNIMLYIVIGKINNFINIVTIYSIVSILAYFLMIYLINYVETSNSLYRKYKDESTKDYLTGLYNTRQYGLLFGSISKNIVQNKEELGFLIIDIDYFKKINDTYGHHIGDLILIQLADLLKQTGGSTEIISRIGGEEFCILSLGSNVESSMKLAENIREMVEKHNFYISQDDFIHITVSIGFAVYPISTHDTNKLKEIADVALYKSKQNGRNQVNYL